MFLGPPSIREEVEGSPLTVDAALLEGIAEHVHEARDRTVEGFAESLAAGQGVAVETDRGFPDGFDGIWDPVTRTVIVRPSRDAALLTLRILHELAHLLLQEQGWRHSHGDVWHLTLALAAPRSVLAKVRGQGPLGVAAAGRVPAWAGAWRLLATG